jgi:RNA polymerase sigma factor (sigma-70 family)
MVANGHYSDTLRYVRTLFAAGTLSGCTDQQLLERFRAGDESAEHAFAALVERHGPMVLHVCRSTLGNSQDGDDAFQATFLVLVRRARSLWVRDSLGPWLHGVAIRVARQARVTATRRRDHERRFAERTPVISSGSFHEAEQAEISHRVHEELSRLPGRYRAPLILCHLEGLTHEQAAEQLCCPVGTVRSRLARGRERFRAQLLKRGLAPCSSVVGIEVLDRTVQSAIPPSLLERACEAVLVPSAGELVPAVVPLSVIKLTEGAIQTMFLTKLRAVSASAIIVTLLGTGIGVSARQALPKGADDRDRPKFDDYGKKGGGYETKSAPYDGKSADYYTKSEQYETKSADYGKSSPYLARNLSRSSFRPHEIVAIPGATVRIRVENPDKTTTECQATVRDDGRLAIVEDIVNPSREESSRNQLTVTELVVTARASREPESFRQWSRSVLTKDDMAKAPYSGPEDASDHERRLRSLEEKFDRVLERLQLDSGTRRNRPLFDVQKK